MVGGGEFKNSLVQQMSGLRACPAEEQEKSTKMPPLSSPSLLFTHDHALPHISAPLPEEDSTATSPKGLHGAQEEGQIPESWSQMLIGGLVGDHERYSTATALMSKGLEKGPMAQAYALYEHGGEEIQASGAMSQLSHMLLASSPRSSCITASLSGSMPEFSNGVAPASATEPKLRNQLSDHSSEVRKERLGDRIAELHQIVCPFGKALSYPYMGHPSTGSSVHQQTDAQDGEEVKKGLRSRGLCLVPVSCTSHLEAGIILP